MLTIKAEIKRNEQKADGTFNVKLRFTLNRNIKRLSTSLFATIKDLTKDYKIKPSSMLKNDVDTLVRGYYDKCSKLQIELNNLSLEDVIYFIFINIT